MALFTQIILSLPITLSPSASYRQLATSPRHFDLWPLELQQGAHSRPNHVYRVGATQRLRQDILDAGQLHHRSHTAAGNDTGARSRWLEEHLSCSISADQ